MHVNGWVPAVNELHVSKLPLVLLIVFIRSKHSFLFINITGSVCGRLSTRQRPAGRVAAEQRAGRRSTPAWTGRDGTATGRRPA